MDKKQRIGNPQKGWRMTAATAESFLLLLRTTTSYLFDGEARRIIRFSRGIAAP
jgi:hypothetical protein